MNILQRKLIAALSLCAAIIVPNVAAAASILSQGTWATTLQARNLEGDPYGVPDAYYDTALNITWLANASAAVGSAYDTYSPGTGEMTWSDANAWAASLNIGGITGWRLPTVTDTGSPGCDLSTTGGTDCGYNVDPATGEMAYMYYVTLGDKSFYDTSGNPYQPGWGLTNTGPFSNLGTYQDYWTSTPQPSSPSTDAWTFSFQDGGQLLNANKPSALYAWAVKGGSVGVAVSTVPLPGAAWLFGSGLLGLIGVARRKLV